MRKIPHKYENFIDNLILDACEDLSEPLHKLNFTPNILTTISLLFGLSSAHQLYKKQYHLSAILFLIAYFFDCMDGHFARKYNMVTNFGDYYDHFCDITKIILIFSVMYYLSFTKFVKIIPLLLILSVLLGLHMSCQEDYYKTTSEEAQPLLGKMSKICKNKSNDYLDITKYFGCGTYFIVIAIIIWNYDREYIIIPNYQ